MPSYNVLLYSVDTGSELYSVQQEHAQNYNLAF